MSNYKARPPEWQRITPQRRRQLQTDAAVESALQLNPTRVAEHAAAIDTLQAMLDAVDPEFATYKQVTCAETGRPVAEMSDESISHVVRIHGREKAHAILQEYHMRQRAPQWQWTNPTHLAQLSRLDPIGYFVRAVSLCFETLPGFTTPWAAHCERQQLFARLETSLRHGDLQPTTLVCANEYTRRVLGLCSPRYISQIRANLSHIGEGNFTEAKLQSWIADMRAILTSLLRIHMEHNVARLNDRSRRVSLADVAYMQQRYGGRPDYHRQSSLHSPNSAHADVAAWLEEIGLVDTPPIPQWQIDAIAIKAAKPRPRQFRGRIFKVGQTDDATTPAPGSLAAMLAFAGKPTDK